MYEDTSKFDDLPMLDAPNSWRIAGIAVWGGHVVNGIRITYERGGVLKSSREVVGYDDPPHEWEQIELRPGEEIIKIEAVISYRIEKLTFRTSQSRHGTFGRGTDGEVHELNVPAVRSPVPRPSTCTRHGRTRSCAPERRPLPPRLPPRRTTGSLRSTGASAGRSTPSASGRSRCPRRSSGRTSRCRGRESPCWCEGQESLDSHQHARGRRFVCVVCGVRR